MIILRHIFPGILLLTACLFSYSCQKETVMNTDGVTLSLTVSVDAAALTKAETRPGDDGRNENVIEWVDLFLFSGKGGAGTEVFRTPYKSLVPVQDAEDPTLYTLSLFLSNDRLDALFGTTNGDPGAGQSATAKIVVVANGDAVSDGDYMVYPSAPSSVQAVRESIARTNLNASYAENLNYLILCGSGDITLTHNERISVSGSIPMTRSYAKLDIALTLPEGGRLEISGRTYQADLANMKIELLNVVHRGYAGSDDTHIKTCTAEDFLSTTTPRALFASGSPLVATHNCFYTYPRRFSDQPGKQTAYRISIPWRAVDSPNGPVHTGYYIFPVADEEVEDALRANHYYHTEAAVHTLGSASQATPETLEGSWEILDWKDTPVYGTFNEYEYLIAYPTWVPMHGLTEGTISYKSSTPLTSYSVTAVKTYGIDMDGEGTDGSETYRSVSDSYLANYTLSYNASAHTITLHHDLELEGGPMYYRQEISVTLHNNDGLEEVVVFEQTSPIDVRSTGHQGSTANLFVDGLLTGQGAGLGGERLSDQYSYMRPPPEEATNTALRYNLRFTVSSFSANNDTYVYGDPHAVNPDRREYIIGDVRINQNKYSKEQFYRTDTDNEHHNTYEWDKTTQLDKIMIADQRISSSSWITPEFICCSGLATSYPQTLEKMEMRAAMYQESGYPAGRWRLMTEAEFKFLADLQVNGIIPKFFVENATYGYWTAQGNCYRFIGPDATDYELVTNPTVGSARFVYDSWYWGPEPDSQSITTYNPQP